jgi:hypothetical protein
MSRDEIQKLLGGYATGTLTGAEQQTLFEAALEDQDLFDALAREQALREVLEDPSARSQLLAALDTRPPAWYRVWWRPAAVACASAVLAIIGYFALRPVPAPVQVAIVKQGVEMQSSHVRQLPAPEVPKAETPAAQPASAVAMPSRSARKPAPPPPPPPEPKVPAAKPGSEPPQVLSQATPAPLSVMNLRENAENKAQAPRAVAPAGVVGGMPGGVAGGTPGGVVGGIFRAAPLPEPPPPAVPNARALYYGEPEPARDFRVLRAAPRSVRPAPSTRMATGAALSAAYPGIRYTFLRVDPAGQSTEVLPSELKDGELVALRITPNDSGTLRVTAGAGTIGATRVEKMNPFTTPAFTAAGQEITVTFDRQAVPASSAFAGSTSIAQQTAADEKATYVVSATPGADRVVFTIRLKRP